MLRTTGYILLAISIISFLLIPVVPFLGFTKVQMAGIATGLLITGEVLFYLSLFILGKSFWEKIKGWFRSLKAGKN